MHESAVLTSVLKYLGNRSDVRCWRNNTGRIADRNGRVVSFGLVGSADVIGMRKVCSVYSEDKDGRQLMTTERVPLSRREAEDPSLIYGRDWKMVACHVAQFLAVECKSDTGRQSEAQRNFQKMVESMGGLYLLVRDVADLYPWFPKE